MITRENISDIRHAVQLLREHMESIRINLEILNTLRLNGRIPDSDEQFTEIVHQEKKIRKSLNEFILIQLPGLIEADLDDSKAVLKKSYLDWAADLHLSLSHQDFIIKKFMNCYMDQHGAQTITNQEDDVKDKRFWKFLEEGSGLNQAADPEKGKTEQQGEEEQVP
jgi:hypothetical protein